MGIPKFFLVAEAEAFWVSLMFLTLHLQKLFGFPKIFWAMDRATTIRRFPHLLPKERVLWNLFLDKHMSEYEYFEYDVHVGQGVSLPSDIPPEIRRMALALSRKRIDVVGHQKTRIILFEIKPDAGLSCIGQLLAYLYLYKVQFRPSLPVKTHIISDIIDIDTKSTARAYGINWTTININWNDYIYDKVRREFIKKKSSL